MKHLYIISVIAALTVAGCTHNDGSATTGSGDLTVSIDLSAPGKEIPADFSGLSFETGSVRINNAQTKGYFFSDENTQSLHIFKELGIRHLRIGGGSVDTNPTVPTRQDIDEFFQFARKAGVSVIYSFRLLNGDLENEVETAKYVWDNYKDCIECFAIGNEPDWDSYHREDPEIRDYPSYLSKWTRFAQAIKAEIPEIRFTGPNTGSNYPVYGAKDTRYDGKSWTVNFAEDWAGKDMLYSVAQHNYVGQDAAKLTPDDMIPKILSTNWNEVQYPALYDAVVKPVTELGYSCRLQESNSFSSASEGGSNSFATALFSLDYMHWWARHDCAGVNFHNKQWVLNAPIGKDNSGNLYVNPVGYGIKAFSISGKGNILPVSLSDNNKNVTAYASVNGKHIYVTLINREYGNNAENLTVNLDFDAEVSNIRTLALETTGGNPFNTSARLGGALIGHTEDWDGEWKNIGSGSRTVEVKKCSALIIDIMTK